MGLLDRTVLGSPFHQNLQHLCTLMRPEPFFPRGVAGEPPTACRVQPEVEVAITGQAPNTVPKVRDCQCLGTKFVFLDSACVSTLLPVCFSLCITLR